MFKQTDQYKGTLVPTLTISVLLGRIDRYESYDKNDERAGKPKVTRTNGMHDGRIIGQRRVEERVDPVSPSGTNGTSRASAYGALVVLFLVRQLYRKRKKKGTPHH